MEGLEQLRRGVGEQSRKTAQPLSGVQASRDRMSQIRQTLRLTGLLEDVTALDVPEAETVLEHLAAIDQHQRCVVPPAPSATRIRSAPRWQ